MTLGVFHFDFPNLDARQIMESDQIDVLLPKYQDEIEKIADKLAHFNPDIIVIERPLDKQSVIDSLFNAYISGSHSLSRSEDEQLGFRIAKKCNSKIYCADAWGEHIIALDVLLSDEQSDNYIAFENSFSDNPDSLLYFNDENIFKQKGY